jgi:hypothetical protein
MAPGSVAAADNIASTSVGFEYLGGARLTAAGTTLTATLLARDGIQINILIAGMAALGEIRLRVGTGTPDAGAVYWYKPFTSGQFVGVATFASPALASQTSIMLNANTQTLDASHIVVMGGNRGATTKPIMWQATYGSGAVGTIPTVGMGSGEWVNTTGQITSVQVFSTTNMLAGTTIMGFGRNYP